MGPLAGLSRPARDRLTLYVLGSGYGESSVVVFPRAGNARAPVVVVDTCTDGDTHLTLDLLAELKIARVDLLIVTHSDLDHVRGLPRLFDTVPVTEAWRFPGAADVRTLAAKWLRSNSGDRRLQELSEAMRRLDQLADANGCVDACASTRAWHPGVRAPRVTCLAPSQHDQRRAAASLDGLVRLDAPGPQLAEEIQRFFDGRSRRIGAVPNVLSLAATVAWRAADLRLVLGGDVERGDGTEYSGWRGILATLDRRKQRDLIRDARAVKVAHHGSRGAWEPAGWDEHVRPTPAETWAIIAPFKHGGVTLPDAEVLRELYGRGVRLAICDAAPARSTATSGGWIADAAVSPVCDGPVIALSWDASGACAVERGARASVYTAGTLARPVTGRSRARGRSPGP